MLVYVRNLQQLVNVQLTLPDAYSPMRHSPGDLRCNAISSSVGATGDGTTPVS